MSDSKKKIKLTPEQIKYIQSLPIRTFQFGSTERSGYYDDKNRMFYFIRDGKMTGRVARMTDPSFHPESDVSRQEEKDTTDAASPSPQSFISRIRNKTKDAPRGNEKQSTGVLSKNPLLKIGLGAVIILSVIVIGGSFFSNNDSAQLSTSSNESTAAEEGNGQHIIVVQVKRDLAPGDVITAADIQESTMSQKSYDEMTMGDAKLYQWDRRDSLVDKYATQFIAKGQYLTYENVDSVYSPNTNPWLANMNGYEQVSIPIPEDAIGNDSLNYGTNLDITITKRTVNESSTDPNSEKEIDGIEHTNSVEQSYLIDTYELHTTIADLLDPSGNSLYNTFYSWISIPAGEQLSYLKGRFKEGPDFFKNIEPTYIAVKVTEEQSKELADILSDDSEITFSFTSDKDDASTEKSNFIAKTDALFLTISQAEQETAQEAAAADKKEGDNES